MTAPWSAEAAQLITGPHQLAVEVSATDLDTGTTVPVEVDTCRVWWSETSAPRCRAIVTGPVPDDLATLHLLDPRRPVRLTIAGGYRLGSGQLDVQPVATLDLRVRDVTRPANTMTLEAAGVEVRMIDAGLPVAMSVPPGSAQSLIEAIGQAVVTGTFYGYDGTVPLVVDPALADVDEVDFDSTADTGTPWDQADDWADTLAADLYDQGDGVLRLGPRPAAAGVSVLQLRTGPGGNLTRSTSRLSREGWHNSVHVAYEAPGTARGSGAYGNADAGPPWAPAQVGYVTAVERRPRRRSTATANAAAAAILERTVARGRSYQLSAPAALWVRPGHTVTVQLVTGAQERHLVTGTDLDLLAGVLTLTTRLPDGALPIGE